MSTITLTGCSGNNYTFTIYRKGQSFRAVGGVYYIARIINQTDYRIYLGITNDLSTRFENHHKENCFRRYRATHVCVLQSSNQMERERIEKDILCYYNFPCNEVNN